ncbi:hypothetical protein PVAP13_3KG206286 [Panicum virgatum]|uniref:Uncharacterized protein n=1 Tax=Panicum virgatum TaxID=38727 RepID=A0A8T0URP7_PANVG|nr:hypothetical protein PVAP13_3KG206286 [Panicum virgatum]
METAAAHGGRWGSALVRPLPGRGHGHGPHGGVPGCVAHGHALHGGVAGHAVHLHAPMGAAPLLGPRAKWAVAPPAATSLMPPRPNAPRQPKKHTTGLPKAARKKPGPKKKMPSSTLVVSASTPTTNSSASASIASPNCGTEEDTHIANNVFDGMSASANSFSNMMDESVEVETSLSSNYCQVLMRSMMKTTL